MPYGFSISVPTLSKAVEAYDNTKEQEAALAKQRAIEAADEERRKLQRQQEEQEIASAILAIGKTTSGILADYMQTKTRIEFAKRSEYDTPISYRPASITPTGEPVYVPPSSGMASKNGEKEGLPSWILPVAGLGVVAVLGFLILTR